MFGFGLLLGSNIHSQGIVGQLKQFYQNADMDCYLPRIQKNINDFFVLDNQIWGRDRYGIVPPKIELEKDKIVPMLTIQFINTDSFNLNDDIYNHIAIDSSIVFMLACVDKQMNVKAFAHFFLWVDGYYEVDKVVTSKTYFEKLKLKHIIRNINKQKPEMILFCGTMMGFHDHNGFMFVRNGKIYVYRVIEKDFYELNDYIRRFFSLKTIRELNYSYLPVIYQDHSIRRTGHTPENAKMICP